MQLDTVGRWLAKCPIAVAAVRGAVMGVVSSGAQ